MMKNVYSTPLRYKNFNDVERTTKLHFHITPREFADWMIDNMAEANDLIRKFEELGPDMEANAGADATTEQKLTLLKLVRILAELGYGVPSDDGEVFDKSERKRFIYSAAYDAFRLFLFEHPKELVEFMKVMLNDEVMTEFQQRMAAANAEANVQGGNQPASVAAVQKDPKDMTHEELVAAMQARNSQ